MNRIFSKSSLVTFTLSLITLFIASPFARAAGWVDDFTDGSIVDDSPATWTFNELGASPGLYDPSSGDLELSADGDPMPVLPTDPADNNLVPTVPLDFGDTFSRTLVKTEPDDANTEARGNAGIALRWNPQMITGYVVLIDHGDQLEVLRIDGGAPTPLAILEDIGVNTLTDAFLEVAMVGDELSIFAWQQGDQRPALPIATLSDSNYSSGRAGLFFNEDSDGHKGIFRYALTQDIPFVVGDFDTDGQVNHTDLAQWGSGFGYVRSSDANLDGFVDGADFLIWQQEFGNSETVGATNVPELSSLTSAAILMFVAGMVQRRRTSS